MATDYDELRSDVKESQDNSLEALQSANAPDARSVVLELDEADGLDGAGVPGGEFVAEELVVQVIPQAEDEFTCYSCFLVRHRSQIAGRKTATATARTAKANSRASQHHPFGLVPSQQDQGTPTYSRRAFPVPWNGNQPKRLRTISLTALPSKRPAILAVTGFMTAPN